MKSIKFEPDGKGFIVYGVSGSTIGHIHKERVGRKNKLCLVSDDLSWWRPDCLRKVADFIDSQENAESPATVRAKRPVQQRKDKIANKCTNCGYVNGHASTCFYS